MPTPTGPATPNKPTLPGASGASATPGDEKADPKNILNDPNMTPGDKLKTLGSLFGKGAVAGAKPAAGRSSLGAGATATAGAKLPGERAFSLKTQHDPEGSIHLYAKNPQDAKTKYQKLGNPLGNIEDALEVNEDGLVGAFVKGAMKKKYGQGRTSGSSMSSFKDYNSDSYSKDSGLDPQDAGKPFSAYTPGTLSKERRGNGVWDQVTPKAASKPSTMSSTSTDSKHNYIIISDKHRRGDIRIRATSPADAERKYSKLNPGDKIFDIKPAKVGENMTTTLKTTFEGLEDQIAGVLEDFGLENGRDFYIDGNIHTMNEQVAQDILGVLTDYDLPGQARLSTLDEQWSISLIGQGEELIENLTVGSDTIEIKHIGEGVVRVYVNSELAEQFDTGTAAFKYVKALQENLAEAEHELMSALSAEAGEDLMKVSKITEGWSDWEDKKSAYRKAGSTVDGKEEDYTVTAKDGSRRRYQDTKTGRKVTSLEPVEKPEEKDADGNKVKRGRGRPKKVRESIATLRAVRRQVTEALDQIDQLPAEQRNSPQIQAMVDRLSHGVRQAIARTK